MDPGGACGPGRAGPVSQGGEGERPPSSPSPLPPFSPLPLPLPPLPRPLSWPLLAPRSPRARGPSSTGVVLWSSSPAHTRARHMTHGAVVCGPCIPRAHRRRERTQPPSRTRRRTESASDGPVPPRESAPAGLGPLLGTVVTWRSRGGHVAAGGGAPRAHRLQRPAPRLRRGPFPAPLPPCPPAPMPPCPP